MNRRQRRKLKSEEKVKTYNLTAQQIEDMKSETMDRAMEIAFVLMLGIPCISLRDEFGFGRARLTRFMDKVASNYQAFDEGYVTLEDMIDTVNKETGVTITRRMRKR